MRGKCFEYMAWMCTFRKHNISFNYAIKSDGFHIYECNGIKFKWSEQSDAYKYVRDLYSKLKED